MGHEGRRSIPVGVEQVLYAAAVDEAFRDDLISRRDAAVRERGFVLKETELATLRMVPEDQLRSSIRGIDTSAANLRRRTFLGAVAAGATAVSLAGCDEPVATGIRPDDLGSDGPPPVTGIRPDLTEAAPADGPAEGGPRDAGPEVSSDSVEAADLGSFGIRPGD